MPVMEYDVEYGIGVNNRFAGFGIDLDDPVELIQRAQEKEKALKSDKKQTKPVKGGKPQEKTQQAPKKEVIFEDTRREGMMVVKISTLFICCYM